MILDGIIKMFHGITTIVDGISMILDRIIKIFHGITTIFDGISIILDGIIKIFHGIDNDIRWYKHDVRRYYQDIPR